MSSAPTPDEIARDAAWLAQALDPRGRRAPGRDGPRQLSRRELPRRPHAAAAGRRAARAVAARSRPQWTATCAATRAGSSTSAMSARPWSRACSASSRRAGGARAAAAARPRAEPAEVRRALSSPPVPKLMSRTFAAEEVAWSRRPASSAKSPPSWCRRASARCSCTRRPRNYIASILAGENSVKELHALADIARRAPGSARHQLSAAAQRCRARRGRLGVRNDARSKLRPMR